MQSLDRLTINIVFANLNILKTVCRIRFASFHQNLSISIILESGYFRLKYQSEFSNRMLQNGTKDKEIDISKLKVKILCKFNKIIQNYWNNNKFLKFNK